MSCLKVQLQGLTALAWLRPKVCPISREMAVTVGSNIQTLQGGAPAPRVHPSVLRPLTRQLGETGRYMTTRSKKLMSRVRSLRVAAADGEDRSMWL